MRDNGAGLTALPEGLFAGLTTVQEMYVLQHVLPSAHRSTCNRHRLVGATRYGVRWRRWLTEVSVFDG